MLCVVRVRFCLLRLSNALCKVCLTSLTLILAERVAAQTPPGVIGDIFVPPGLTAGEPPQSRVAFDGSNWFTVHQHVPNHPNHPVPGCPDSGPCLYTMPVGSPTLGWEEVPTPLGGPAGNSQSDLLWNEGMSQKVLM